MIRLRVLALYLALLLSACAVPMLTPSPTPEATSTLTLVPTTTPTPHPTDIPTPTPTRTETPTPTRDAGLISAARQLGIDSKEIDSYKITANSLYEGFEVLQDRTGKVFGVRLPDTDTWYPVNYDVLSNPYEIDPGQYKSVPDEILNKKLEFDPAWDSIEIQNVWAGVRFDVIVVGFYSVPNLERGSNKEYMLVQFYDSTGKSVRIPVLVGDDAQSLFYNYMCEAGTQYLWCDTSQPNRKYSDVIGLGDIIQIEVPVVAIRSDSKNCDAPCREWIMPHLARNSSRLQILSGQLRAGSEVDGRNIELVLMQFRIETKKREN